MARRADQHRGFHRTTAQSTTAGVISCGVVEPRRGLPSSPTVPRRLATGQRQGGVSGATRADAAIRGRPAAGKPRAGLPACQQGVRLGSMAPRRTQQGLDLYAEQGKAIWARWNSRRSS